MNLWHDIGNRCLERAFDLLNDETAPTEETVETVKSLVMIAVAVDDQDIRWESQSRYGAQVFRDPSFSQKEGENSTARRVGLT